MDLMILGFELFVIGGFALVVYRLERIIEELRKMNALLGSTHLISTGMKSSLRSAS